MEVFNPPERYRTRDGQSVIVFAKARGVGLGPCLIGCIEFPDGEVMESKWLMCGKFNAYEIGDHTLDLVEKLGLMEKL